MNIKYIRRYLNMKIGSPITIVYYGSRNKKERYSGVLLKTYSNIFLVRLVTGEIRSVSYVDILIKTVQICI